MTAAPYSSLNWEDVQDGQLLPSFDYELSMVRLIAFVRATGLYDYVHHDPDYARAVGAKDAFAATPHIGGLFTRLITDRSGPASLVRLQTPPLVRHTESHDGHPNVPPGST